ncbi:MAG: isoprenylcysteine carboxylmethyltransferase family protein [Flavobacteriaceae bacterium]|nr:isoprenylcysteine carboxylmethyltransferase family protein [Flavobacteriaceae bacterium]
MKISTKDYIYVLIQLILFALLLFEIKILQFSIPKYIESLSIALLLLSIIFLISAFLQLNKYLSPFPTPVKNSKLVTQGVFAFSRHPIYTALILGVFSLGIFFGSGYKLILAFVIMLFFCFKTNYEEKKLIKQFPEYNEYKKNTGKFFTLFLFKRNE